MSNMGNMARDTAKDARDAVKETGKVASAGAKDIQEDLEALRDDVAQLTQQLAGVLAAKGNKAWRRAKSNVEGVISDVQDAGMEAVGAVREVGDNVVDASRRVAQEAALHDARARRRHRLPVRRDVAAGSGANVATSHRRWLLELRACSVAGSTICN